jgi:hypothetical protein
MSKSHNKKRNTGIIYELLLRSVSDSLVCGENKKAQNALNIIDRFFSTGTEIYKEFRLFNALANSTVSDTSVAAAILSEAKSASRRSNPRALEREKSLLIKEINHNLPDKSFYYRKISDYKIYATIQNLLNEWRLGDVSSLSKIVQYEGQVVERLLEEKTAAVDISEQVDSNVDTLVTKIMTEKFNNKYADTLSQEQKEIIRSYVFSIAKDQGESIREFLSEMSTSLVKSLEELREETDNKVLLEKIDKVKIKIESLDIEDVNDETVSRFLVVSQLNQEIMEGR